MGLRGPDRGGDKGRGKAEMERERRRGGGICAAPLSLSRSPALSLSRSLSFSLSLSLTLSLLGTERNTIGSSSVREIDDPDFKSIWSFRFIGWAVTICRRVVRITPFSRPFCCLPLSPTRTSGGDKASHQVRLCPSLSFRSRFDSIRVKAAASVCAPPLPTAPSLIDGRLPRYLHPTARTPDRT